MSFSTGQRVLVRQKQGAGKPDLFWKSRVLRYGDDALPVIATSAEKNPCHAEWPYFETDLTVLDDGTADWALQSPFKTGQTVYFTLHRATPQYEAGALLTAVLECPHIEAGDWYVSFPTPEGWRFKMVVPESLLEA